MDYSQNRQPPLPLFPPPPPPPPMPPMPLFQTSPFCQNNSQMYPGRPPYANYNQYHQQDGSYVDYYAQQNYGPPQYDQSYYNNDPNYANNYDPYMTGYPSTSHYSQLNELGQNLEDGELLEEEDMNVVVNEVDDSEDWRRCTVCDMPFEDEKAYNRHSRGLIHTQRMLQREQEAGLIEPEPVPKQEIADVSMNRKNTNDPNKRDLFPSEVGRATFDERYFCHHCKCPCSGIEAYEMHLKGKRHAKTLKTKVSAGISVDLTTERQQNIVKNFFSPVVEAVVTGKRATIQDKMDRCSEPLIGLKYVVEYVSPSLNEPRYVCNLCEAKCDMRTIFSHLIGYKHRLQYFKEIRSDIYAEIQLCADNREEQADLLTRRSSEIEAEEGRPAIVQRSEVVQNFPVTSKNGTVKSKPTNFPKGKGEINVNDMFPKQQNHSNDVFSKQRYSNDTFAKHSHVDDMFVKQQNHSNGPPSNKRPRSPTQEYHPSKRRSSPLLKVDHQHSSHNGERNSNLSPDARSDMSLSDDDRRYSTSSKSSAAGTSSLSTSNESEVKMDEKQNELGYYYRERNYNLYDEKFVRPYEKTVNATASSSSTTPQSTNTLKNLLTALAQASMNVNSNDKEAVKMSSLLTKAILKVKNQRLLKQTAANLASVATKQPTPPPPPTPLSNDSPGLRPAAFKPKLGSGYYQ